MCGFISRLSILSRWSVSDSVPALYCFSYYSFVSEVETRSKISPALFFLKIILSVWGLSGFHTDFRIIWSNSRKYIIWTLIGIALNVDIALGCMNIITILILPIHGHRISFYFFVSYLLNNLFYQCHSFQHTGPFTSLTKFASRNFILSDAIINEVAFLISLSDIPL